VDNPRVHALVVYNSNPAAIAPHQALVRRGLERKDLFTVVLEQTLTDTARHADYVLPATTFLEHDDLYYSYGHYHLQMTRAVADAPGECRPNTAVFRALAARLGFNEPCFADTDEAMIRQALDTSSPYLAGISYERLAHEHSIRLNVPELPMAGRAANFDGEPLAYVPPLESRLGTARTAEYPLELISSKNHDSMNSTFAYRADVDAQTAILEMHPDDAAPRGITEGTPVLVVNARGSVQLTARVGPHTRPGVVRAPMVRGAGQSNANLLIGDRLTDIGAGPCFYNCLVEVRRCDV
jgi:anaerobic selenocysteine-containing dehydrogenase